MATASRVLGAMEVTEEQMAGPMLMLHISVNTQVARRPRVITMQKGTRKGQIAMQRATCKGCSPGAKVQVTLTGSAQHYGTL